MDHQFLLQSTTHTIQGEGMPVKHKARTMKLENTKDMPATLDQAVLTVRETAVFLRICESTVWAEIKKGNLKPLRFGDRVLFSRIYLERLLAQE